MKTILLCALLMLLASIAPTARAEWKIPGVKHVPICGDGAFEVGEGTPYGSMWVGAPQALEDPLSAADLSALRDEPGFRGLTDAQIQAKMFRIRREVWDAIDRLAAFDQRLALCLESVFLNRRLFLEFSNRPVVGAVDGNSLGKLAGDCGNGSIAIKVYPCDTVPDYDATFVVMLAALAHEGTHLGQTWTEGYRDITRLKWWHWREELDKRLIHHCNEIEASERERSIVFGMWLAMRGIKLRGTVPDDNASIGTVIPPMVRALAEEFLKATPEAERAAKADAIVRALTSHVDRINATLSCRRLVKAKLEEMRSRPPLEDETGLLPLQQEWLAFIRTTGWFQMFGDATLSGVFSLAMIAGGAQPEANQVRQYDAMGDVRSITLPGLSVITDVSFLNDRTILVGGPSTTAGQGAVYALTDTNMDNLLDPASLSLITRISGLAGGVSLACDPAGGHGFCLGRQTGNLYAFNPLPPALPVSLTFQTAINNAPVLDENFFLLLPQGSDRLFFVPEFGGCVTETTQWTSAPSSGTIANRFRVERPIEHCLVPPVFVDHVFRGDTYVRCGGMPDREIKLYNDAQTPPALLGTTTTAPNGTGLFRLPAITGSPRLRLRDAAYGDSATFTPGPPITKPNTVILPDMQYVPGRAFPVVAGPLYFGPPHTSYRMEFSEHAIWSPSSPAVGTVNGSGIAALLAGPPPEVAPPTGFWRTQWLGRSDIVPENRIFSVTAGMTTTIDLSAMEFDFGAPNGQSNATYTVLSRDGLHEDLIRITPGTSQLHITPLLLSTPSGSPDIIQVRRTDAVDQNTQDLLIELYSCREALIEPVETGGLLFVPCLLLTGGACPIYQFTLSNNPADLCTVPHWHSGGTAFAIDSGSTLTEPPDSCGWGTIEAVPIAFYPATPAVWLSFLAAHPPNVSLFN